MARRDNSRGIAKEATDSILKALTQQKTILTTQVLSKMRERLMEVVENAPLSRVAGAVIALTRLDEYIQTRPGEIARADVAQRQLEIELLAEANEDFNEISHSTSNHPVPPADSGTPANPPAAN